jgi:hypothetical protein
MRNIKINVIIFILCLSVYQAQAPKVYSLEKCKQMALEDLKIAWVYDKNPHLNSP